MKLLKINIFLALILVIILLTTQGCVEKEAVPAPKPFGYFRISLPEAQYQKWDSILPCTFDYSQLANIKIDPQEDGKYWIDLTYPQFNASMKITYFPVRNNLRELIENDEKMVMFHVDRRKADDVQYSVIEDPKAQIYGQIYDIIGKEVASPFQFWVTDSSQHYVRGALYFNFTPNNDSLAPVIQYLRKDLLHIVETWSWK